MCVTPQPGGTRLLGCSPMEGGGEAVLTEKSRGVHSWGWGLTHHVGGSLWEGPLATSAPYSPHPKAQQLPCAQAPDAPCIMCKEATAHEWKGQGRTLEGKVPVSPESPYHQSQYWT